MERYEFMVEKVGENHCSLGKVKLFERNTVHYSGKINFFETTGER